MLVSKLATAEAPDKPSGLPGIAAASPRPRRGRGRRAPATAWRDGHSKIMKIAPRSLTVLPMAEADKAFRYLEDGVTGKIVLNSAA
jgi:hypothetical protein